MGNRDPRGASYPLATGSQPHPINSVQSSDSEGLPEAVSYPRFAVCGWSWSVEASGSVEPSEWRSGERGAATRCCPRQAVSCDQTLSRQEELKASQQLAEAAQGVFLQEEGEASRDNSEKQSSSAPCTSLDAGAFVLLLVFLFLFFLLFQTQCVPFSYHNFTF